MSVNKMEIVFIRHAEKEQLGEDSNLTSLGIKQAEHLAKRLTKEHFDEFYCSALNRAKQTSEIISKNIALKPKIESCLNEFKSETLFKKRAQLTEEEKKHHLALIKFLKKITSNPSQDKSILIIAHGLTNRLILAHLFKINAKRVIPFRQSEGGMNIIYWADKFNNWRLKTWNDNNHIPNELRSTY